MITMFKKIGEGKSVYFIQVNSFELQTQFTENVCRLSKPPLSILNFA